MITTNLIPALGWTLLHSLWQGALLFLLAAPLLLALKGRSPRLRYGLALTTMLILLVGMSWTLSTQLEFIALDTEPSMTTPTVVPVEEDVPAVPVLSNTESARTAVPPSASATSTFSWPQFLEANVVYLVAIWGLGVFFFAFRWFNMLIALSRMQRKGVRRLSGEWEGRLFQLRKRMGIERIVGLLESNQIDTPLVIGYFKPVILLPIGLVNGLSTAQVEAILAHELAHVGRRDFLINLLLTSLEVILFYHPVYWWLMARINEEREQCCDDVAVAACGNPNMYAWTLLSVEEHRQAGSLALAFAGEGGQLQTRIKRICRATPRHHPSASLRLWLLLPLLGCVMAFAYAGVPARGEVATEDASTSVADLARNEVNDEFIGIDYPNVVTPEPADAAATNPPTFASPEERIPLAVAPLPSVPPTVSLPDRRVEVPAIKLTTRRTLVSVTDSFPKPVIPSLREEPLLPAAPKFSLTTSEIRDLLAQGEEGRRKLRGQTNAYRNQISDWNDALSAEFLKPWRNQRERIMDAYNDWSDELRTQSADKLAYAITHEEMTHLFEDAFERHEDAMEEVEDAIEDQYEDTTETLEKAIERGEKSIKEHSDRMQVHSTRMNMHSVRMQIHSGRMRVHSARMQMHSARMQLHNERMKSHGIIMAALEDELREALTADGFLARGDKDFRFEVTSTTVTFNGEPIGPASLAQKYRDILAKYGKGDVAGDPRQTFMIHIDGRSRSIGTRYDGRN